MQPMQYTRNETTPGNTTVVWCMCRQREQAKETSLVERNLADIAKAQKLVDDVSETAPKATCVACFDEVAYLDGAVCPAKEHFMCNECFDGWVLSESAAGDGHVPKQAGEVWCMYKADVQSMDGCKSERPFNPRVRPAALHEI